MYVKFLYLFMLLFAADLPLLRGAEEGSLQEVVDKLELYDKDATGNEFIKLLSWSYNEKMETYLTDFIEYLEPTIIAIQNITSGKLKTLSRRDIMSHYEMSGIKQDSTISDNEIANPIFYKGDRLQPPVIEEKFTGVEKNEKNGEIAWAQFHIVDMSLSKANRNKRDLPTKKNQMEMIFKGLQPAAADGGGDTCNVPGTIVVLNANLKDTNDRSEGDLLDPIYEKVLCRRRKKTFLAGNVGWTKSHSALYEFAKNMLKVKTFSIDNDRNLNQIWTNDFDIVQDISANIRKYKGDDVIVTVPGDGSMMMAPTFAAFH